MVFLQSILHKAAHENWLAGYDIEKRHEMCVPRWPTEPSGFGLLLTSVSSFYSACHHSATNSSPSTLGPLHRLAPVPRTLFPQTSQFRSHVTFSTRFSITCPFTIAVTTSPNIPDGPFCSSTFIFSLTLTSYMQYHLLIYVYDLWSVSVSPHWNVNIIGADVCFVHWSIPKSLEWNWHVIDATVEKGRQDIQENWVSVQHSARPEHTAAEISCIKLRSQVHSSTWAQVKPTWPTHLRAGSHLFRGGLCHHILRMQKGVVRSSSGEWTEN